MVCEVFIHQIFLLVDTIPSVEWHGSFLVGEKRAKPVYEYFLEHSFGRREMCKNCIRVLSGAQFLGNSFLNFHQNYFCGNLMSGYYCVFISLSPLGMGVGVGVCTLGMY